MDEVNFGSERILAGLIISDACLTSSLLFCSEVWTPLSLIDINKLEKIDNKFKRKLMKAQAKTPIISFHLELGTLKLRHLILLRRLLYFHCIVTKDENDLTKKILYKQLADTTNGDFIEQIKNDHEYLGLKFNLSELKDTSKDFFKSKIKKIIKKVAFN